MPWMVKADAERASVRKWVSRGTETVSKAIVVGDQTVGEMGEARGALGIPRGVVLMKMAARTV